LRSTKVTLKDIAHATGVDISTVSRSLSGSYGINKETRERVLATAAELNYHPNRVARGLATGRSHTVGLIVSDIRNPFFAELARGAEDAACAAGCDVVLCNSDLDPAKQMRYIRALLSKRVDGILMNSVGGLDRTQQEQLAGSGLPVVLLNRPRTASAFCTVSADNDEGGYLAGEYLIRLGHVEIAHISGPRDHGNLRERARGFLRAFADTPSRKPPMVLYGEHHFKGGYELARTIVARHPQITAIFAANDIMAFGAMRALMEAGIGIPESISVVGFDNVEFAAVVHPPLTTVHQPKYEMGRAAVEMILASADRAEAPVPEHRQFGVKLIERQSCAPPRAQTNQQ
jgi:DNA-binding LacI/PurR family transcriptional regulator